MRILQLSFKNLNSLAGEWRIDFTHPAFASEGIFSITGPTGAGKTTILDALCLALYGRTPRLKYVTKTENEIMSRRTGECYAEVTFETQAGRFRCRWSQHRARKRPNGELQALRRECVNVDTNGLLESKVERVSKKVEAITGMDFERFTRSMLLAQGGFSAFLQASPDTRAPILEQLTGMEIYSDISKRVHERTVAERNRLDMLEAELAGLHLLDGDEEARLEVELAALNERNAIILRRIDEHQQAILWVDGLRVLQTELAQLEERKIELMDRITAFQPQRLRLKRAIKALELAGENAGLGALRAAQAAELRQMETCRASLSDYEQQAKATQDALAATAETVRARKEEQRTGAQSIREARECDLRLREKDATLLALRKDYAEREKALRSLEDEARQTRERLEAGRSALRALDDELERTASDQGLVENLTGLRGRFGLLRDQARLLDERGQALREAERRREESGTFYAAALEERERAKNETAKLRQTLEERRAELNKALEGRSAADWRGALLAAGERKARFETLADTLRAFMKARETLAALEERREAMREEATALRGRLAALQSAQEERETERETLETETARLATLHSYEEARKHLEDGAPCPLCGALDHPFVKGNIPEADAARKRLDSLKRHIREEAETLLALQRKMAALDAETEMLSERGREETKDAAGHARRLEEGLTALDLTDAGPFSDPSSALALAARLDDVCEAETRTWRKAETTLRRAEELEKSVETAREAWENARTDYARTERETEAALHRRTRTEEEAERLRREQATLADHYAATKQAVLREAAPYGIAVLSADETEELLRQLDERRLRWQARTRRREILSRENAQLEVDVRHREAQLAEGRAERDRLRAVALSLRAERDAVEADRRERLGDASPDAEEARLERTVREAETQLEKARKLAEAATRDLVGLRNKLDMLEQTTAERAGHIEPLERDFRLRLTQAGFADEDDYRAACLPEEERERLRENEQRLRAEQTEIDARRKDKAAHIAAEQRKNMTPLSREQLDVSLAALRDDAKEQQERIGGIRQKIEENREVKAASAERAAAVAAQRREYNRWKTLHDLIGSSDGKKYRNFVQVLTFEIMIDHANRQLQRMSDRYLLIRNTAQPLELDVIDNYQAGEVRSAKNLSGGESFIVSLALALGLSQMTSKTVRVDSLFLDEGFGTLDEEALDTALETLAGLHRDGKLIGVISHVSALKERIGTQIQVVPTTGGRSAIRGPGCSRCGDA